MTALVVLAGLVLGALVQVRMGDRIPAVVWPSIIAASVLLRVVVAAA